MGGGRDPETTTTTGCALRVDLVARDACAWPVAVGMADGAVGLVFHNRPSHGFSEGDLTSVMSRDQGETWRPTGLAAPHDPGSNRAHIAAGVDHDGAWIVLSTGHRLCDGRMAGLAPVWLSRRMGDDGAWQVWREVRVEVPAAWCIPHGRILALDDGRLAATFYMSEGRGKPSRTWIVFSEDGGRRWRGARQIGDGDTNEAVLLAPGADRLIAAVRTHRDHHVDLFFSDDAGIQWRSAGAVTLPMQHPADLTALGSGRVLLTFGLRNRGLMGVGARLSCDGGQSWGAPVVLCQFPGASDCGYPSSVVVESAGGAGGMLTACYSDRSSLYEGYQLLVLRWRLDDWFDPRPLRSISDGGPLQV